MRELGKYNAVKIRKPANGFTLVAMLIATTLLLAAPASYAQTAVPQVSMVTLQVVQNQDRSQSVITPKGDLATLPGAGVNGNTAVIYMGAQGGFWYTDKTGQNVSLDATVSALQARRAANQQTAPVPQYAPEPYSSGTGSSGGGGGVGSALGTAAAAGLGAMGGAAMANHYYNAPYGTPMYYGAAGHPYCYGNGEQIEDLNSDQKAALQNHYQTKQQNKQQALQQSQDNRQARLEQTGSNQQSRQQSVQQNQGNRQSQIAQSGGQQQNYQRQQQWYQNQLKENPKQFQKASNNPFVSQSDFSRHGTRGGREASGQRSSMRAERSGGSARGGGGRGGGGRRR